MIIQLKEINMKKILILLVLFFSITIQSQTITAVQNTINTNLATGTKITAEKHRAVEHALLNLIWQNAPLAKGTWNIGDVPSSSIIYVTVTFTSVGTNNYLVVGTPIYKSANSFNDSACTFGIRNKTATSFEIVIRELSGQVQNLGYDFALIPF